MDSTPHPPERIDGTDFWFLDVVVELATPLRMLLGPDVGLALNKRRVHGLSREALGERLVRLSERGLIRVNADGQEDSPLRTREQIAHALDVSATHNTPSTPRQYLYWYWLTDRGGAVWEQHARPDWSRYVTAWSSTDPNEAVIEAASREVAEAEFRWGEDHGQYRPRPGSRRDEALAPWQATYWKTLPAGYRLQYAWDELPVRERIHRGWAQAPSPSNSAWYTEPDFD